MWATGHGQSSLDIHSLMTDHLYTPSLREMTDTHTHIHIHRVNSLYNDYYYVTPSEKKITCEIGDTKAFKSPKKEVTNCLRA